MKIEVFADADAVAREAATLIAADARRSRGNRTTKLKSGHARGNR